MTSLQKPISRASEKRAAKREAERKKRNVYSFVSNRDGFKCRACGCRLRANGGLEDRLEHHHIILRSAGGADTAENLVTLCPADHADRHAYRLEIVGNGNGRVMFTREGRVWSSEPPK